MKKHELKKKQAALRRRAVASEPLVRLGLGLKDQSIAVGVVLDNMSMSQLNFFALENINQFCREMVGVDVCVFAQQITRCPIVSLCPVYDPRPLRDWRHPLIATSASSCIEALHSPATLIIHYAYSIEFVDRHDLRTDQSIADLHEVYADPRVVVMTRGDDYRKLIETEFDIKVREPLLPDFDLAQMVKVIVSEINDSKGGR